MAVILDRNTIFCGSATLKVKSRAYTLPERQVIIDLFSYIIRGMENHFFEYYLSPGQGAAIAYHDKMYM